MKSVAYSTIEEAALGYNVLALKYHGEFATLNTIKIPRTGRDIISDN